MAEYKVVMKPLQQWAIFLPRTLRYLTHAVTLAFVLEIYFLFQQHSIFCIAELHANGTTAPYPSRSSSSFPKLLKWRKRNNNL